METDNAPLISILMAVYEPRRDWLIEQLESLDAQTYPNLQLYIYDDCSPSFPFAELKAVVRDHIKRFPYQIVQGTCNVGSNRAFEELTRMAEGEYFAYCDQDDIWLPEKIDTLYTMLKANEQAGMICSDVILIDGEGKTLCAGIQTARPRHFFFEGPRLYPKLIYHNFAVGCTMLIRSRIAKAALPFATNMVHDHYLAFYCSIEHEILLCRTPLVMYRQHEKNQTGILANVSNKRQYKEKYIYSFKNRIIELQARFDLPELKNAAEWADARINNARGSLPGAIHLWHLRRTDWQISIFELLALHLPNVLFSLSLKRIRNSKRAA